MREAAKIPESNSFSLDDVGFNLRMERTEAELNWCRYNRIRTGYSYNHTPTFFKVYRGTLATHTTN